MAQNLINVGQIMFYNAGTYSASTAYARDTVVQYANQTFICVAATGTTITGIAPLNISGATGYILGNNTGQINKYYWDQFQPNGLNWRGAWATATAYLPGDVVNYRNNSYICRRAHTSSLNNLDPFYNPYNEWEEFSHGDVQRSTNRTKMLMKRGPIGWNGHPFIPRPNWGNSAYVWNGNIPRNISSTFQRWEWASSDGHSKTCRVANQLSVGMDGRLHASGTSGNYSMGPSDVARPSNQEIDPSWMRDYWNDQNPTPGTWTTTWRKDNTAGHPTVLQTCPGYYDMLVLYNNGTVVKHGYGGIGQTSEGNSNNSTRYGSVQIPFPPGTFIVKIAVGNAAGTDDNTHYLALDSEGFVWSWGQNYYGQLGLGDEVTQGKSIGMLNNATSGATTGGYLDYENVAKRIPRFAFNGYRIVDIFAMGRYAGSSYALDETGVLWSWGYNGYGQLGYPTSSGFRSTGNSTVPFQFGRSIGLNWTSYAGIQKIQCCTEDDPNNGQSSIYILDGQGYLWWCGYNNSYSVGDGATTASTGTGGNPIRITSFGTAGGVASATIAGLIYNFWVLGWGARGNTIFVMTNTGNVYGWGTNNYYDLGQADTTSRNYPVVINGINNVAVMGNGGHGNYNSSAALCYINFGSGQKWRVMTAGYNGYGSLGIGENTSNQGAGGNLGGMFMRPSGYGQYWWQPMLLPGGLHRANEIRDVMMGGWTNQELLQVLYEDGTLMCNGSSGSGGNYYNITPQSIDHPSQTQVHNSF